MKTSYFLIILIILSAFVEFYKLGEQPLVEYDEARYAINAFEMMHNGDYINLYYQGKPDTWVARPPLKSWLIISGYKLFGFNEFGLRFSSGIAIVVFIIFAFLFFKEFFPNRYAFLGCIMLIFSKGIIGFHVGRNGDMDAELIMFLAAFSYFFIKYIKTEKPFNIYISALLLGMAFYLKTTACFIYLPGIFLYLIFSGKLNLFLQSKHVWYSLSLFAIILFSWFLILQWKGVTYSATQSSYHNNTNSWQTMILYDTWQRFTSSTFDGHPVEKNYAFFILSLDSVFTPWNYLFYTGIAISLYLYLNKKTRDTFKQSNAFPAILLTTGVLIPIGLLLTFGMHKLSWYTSPALLFACIPAIFTFQFIFQKIHWMKYILIPLIFFFCITQFQHIQKSTLNTNQVTFIKEHQKLWNTYDTINTTGRIPQNIYAYCLWNNKPVIIQDSVAESANCLYWIDTKADSLDAKKFMVLAKSNKEEHGGIFTLNILKK